jgi:NACalpha-BTF3-like transcription factor
MVIHWKGIPFTPKPMSKKTGNITCPSAQVSKISMANIYFISNIFLVDHAWTTKPENAKKEIKAAPGLLDRLEALMDIEKEEVVDSDDEDEVEEDSNMIDIVSEQANVSRESAKKALAAEKYDLLNAIMRLTMTDEFKAESDRLQEQVMGQIIGEFLLHKSKLCYLVDITIALAYS